MEPDRSQKKSEFDFRLMCWKYILFILNVIFVIASSVMIMSGISISVLLSPYNVMMEYGFNTLIIFALVTGIVLMIVAVVGIAVTFMEKTAFANLYGLAMMLVFVLQVATAVTSFVLMSKSGDMVSRQLDSMMYFYSYEHAYRREVDLIQSQFECCGVYDNTDWQKYGKYSTPWHGFTQSYDDWYPTTHHTTTSTEAPSVMMPATCCRPDSNYVGHTCDQYHSTGCFEPIRQIVSESVLIIGSSALLFSVLQILGIVAGFAYARAIRCRKTQRNVQIWNSDQGGYATLHT
ncbi:CD151 antigen-like [Bradysia coprophila]|uniref:CD151 antigen-like n=1 Tax=Bradysia coprophila TaxID=38358 RepID=UPI00187DD316|nr:CD151 antigen-like [Bradysia coprophila]